MKTAIALLICIFILGCTSSIKTARFDTDKWERTSKKIKGIVYYEPQLVIVTHSYTKFGDSDHCVPTIASEELKIVPDFSRPRILMQSGGLFGEKDYNVTFQNGILTTLDTMATMPRPPSPTQNSALSGIASGVASLASSGLLAPNPMVKPACNSSPVITNVRPFKNP